MPLKLLAPLSFLGLLVLCTFTIWPLYKSAIERDLTRKVEKVYTNQIRNIPEVSFDGLQLKIDTRELTPYRRRKIDRIKGVYLPSGSSADYAEPAPVAEVDENSDVAELTVDVVDRTEDTFFELTRADRTIWLRGVVPAEKWTDELITTLTTIAPGARFINETDVVEGTPARSWWHPRFAELAGPLLQNTHGHLFISASEDSCNVLARSESEEKLTTLRQALAQVPSGITVNPRLVQQARAKVTPPAAIVTAPGETPAGPATTTSVATLSQALSATTIRFSSGMSILNRKQKRALSNLAAVIKSAADPSLVLMIGSYAASESAQATKLGLTRAAAVRQELVSHGIPSTSLLTGHFKMAKGTRRRVEVTIATPDQIASAPAPAEAEKEEKKPEPTPEPEPEPATPLTPFEKVQVSFGGSGSAWLHPKYNPRLKEVIDLANSPEFKDQTFAVESIGTSSRELSKLRAEAVLSQLVTLGMPRNRLVIAHRPDRKPGEARHVRMVPATPEQTARAKQEATTRAKEKANPPAQPKPTEPESEPTEEPTPEPAPAVVVLPPPPPPSPFTDLAITFGGGGSSWLHPKFEPKFDQIGTLLASPEHSVKNVIVVSYGTDNPELARLRAEAVRASLLKRGIPGTRMTTDARPLSENGIRRVEIIFAEAEEKENTPEPPTSTLESEPEAPAATPTENPTPDTPDTP